MLAVLHIRLARLMPCTCLPRAGLRQKQRLQNLGFIYRNFLIRPAPVPSSPFEKGGFFHSCTEFFEKLHFILVSKKLF